MDTEQTRVVFRTWKGKCGGDVIALMPDDPCDYYGYDCLSYEIVGQHGAADYRYVISQTRRATAEESRDTYLELIKMGYRVKEYKREPKDARDIRQATAREWRQADKVKA